MNETRAIRKEVWDKSNGRCWYCGCDLTTANATTDHILPPAKGGSDLLSNLVPACRECNAAKGDAMSLESLREYLIEVAVKGRRAVRVKAVPKPVVYQQLPDGRKVVDVTAGGPFFTLAFYFEEHGLKP